MRIQYYFPVLLLITCFIVTGAVAVPAPGPVSLQGNETAKASGNSYALLIGISSYQDSSNNLEGVQYDTVNMNSALNGECGYAQTRITQVRDNQATKSGIKSALLQMSSKMSYDDTFVFYYSGHGFVYPSGSGMAYIEAYDSAAESVDYDISSSELKQLLDAVPCRKVLVVIDACEAEGLVKAGTKTIGGSTMKSSLIKGGTPERFQERFIEPFTLSDSTVTVTAGATDAQKGLTGSKYLALVSCRSGEGSWTNSDTGSWFTTYLTQGINAPSTDTNGDKWVSAEEAFAYAAPLTTQKHSDQHPVISDGDLVNEFKLAYYGGSTTGTISVSSNPTGAAVYLDGTDTGSVTPATLQNIPAGSHSVRCSKSGYNDKSQTVTVTAGQTTTVSLTLQASTPSTGSISVSTTPSGAVIILDGTDTGVVTPATLKNVVAGSHTIQCTKTGYTSASQGVTVQAGKTATVKMTLQVNTPSTGSISVSSTPSGASILLDGANTGAVTPSTLKNVAAGSHTIQCTKTGYTSTSQGVTVQAGKTVTVKMTLQANTPSTGSISVSSTPSGARVYLDGADTGSVTPATLKNVAAGTHTVKCSMTGYSTGSQTVTVTGGSTVSVKLTLQSGTQATGTITVSSVPSGASIWIDGVDTGTVTPGTVRNVATGSHTVLCRKSGYGDQSKSITVTSGQTTKVSFTLAARSIPVVSTQPTTTVSPPGYSNRFPVSTIRTGVAYPFT